ncbi:MAG TPA: phosphotransferase [Nevskiaceae bacterium]|nr:phosphotransferase [Nevskiaceae bacterium]
MNPIPYAELAERYAEEQRLHPVPLTAQDLPLGYETITPQWLTQVLCGGHPGAEVTAVRLGDADEGTSSRRRLFLQLNDAARRAGLPGTLFCKSTHTLTARARIGVVGFAESEVHFHRDLRPLLDIEAPRAWFANANPHTFNSIVLLHDMTGAVQFCEYTDTRSRAEVEDQLGLLARLHARFSQPHPAAAALRTWAGQFGYLATTPYRKAAELGFRQAERVIPPRLLAREAEVFPATLASALRHAELPETVIHSDVHLRNWYVTRDGRMGLNDWQCICRGHWSRDLAYSVSTALTVEDRRAWERELIAFYLDRLHAAGGPRIESEFAWRHYREQLLGALAWWTGTLGQPRNKQDMQPPDVSMAFIERMAAAVDDVDGLDAAGA